MSLFLSALILSACLIFSLLFRLFPGEGPPWTIALDAGHGGKDRGAIGLIEEVEMTEYTVSILYQLFSTDPNFRPVLTRENGEEADQDQRVAKASGADLLLSVHGNAGPPEASGFECYPKPPGRRWHAESMQLAGLITAGMEGLGARLRGENGIRFVFYDQDGNKFFRQANDTTVYSEQTAGIVEWPDCPAMLVEQGFVTNAGDVTAFASEEGCRASALSYYRAVCRYYGVVPVH